MHKALLLAITAPLLYAGGQPEKIYQRKVPSLQAYAALKVAEQHLAKKDPVPLGLIQETLPENLLPLVEAGCETITHFYGWRHDDNLGTIDCPDMAHFVISRGMITPNQALASAEKKMLRATITELRDRGAQYQARILRDYRLPTQALALGTGELA